MPTTTSWLTPDRADTWRDADLYTARKGDVAREIDDEATSIVIMRGGADLAAQTVRLLQNSGQTYDDAGSEGGEQSEADLVVLGESTLNIQRADRFFADSQLYEVVYVFPAQPNRVEALARQLQ